MSAAAFLDKSLSIKETFGNLSTKATVLAGEGKKKEAVVTAQKALKDADTTLAHTSELTAPGAPLRAELEESLRNLSIASEALRSFAETIDRNPQALVTGVAQP